MKTILLNLTWGLLVKFATFLLDWWNNKKAIKKIVDDVTGDIEKHIETETREEQREALRKLTENIRNRIGG